MAAAAAQMSEHREAQAAVKGELQRKASQRVPFSRRLQEQSDAVGGGFTQMGSFARSPRANKRPDDPPAEPSSPTAARAESPLDGWRKGSGRGYSFPHRRGSSPPGSAPRSPTGRRSPSHNFRASSWRRGDPGERACAEASKRIDARKQAAAEPGTPAASEPVASAPTSVPQQPLHALPPAPQSPSGRPGA
eukprot:gene1796-13048_t